MEGELIGIQKWVDGAVENIRMKNRESIITIILGLSSWEHSCIIMKKRKNGKGFFGEGRTSGEEWKMQGLICMFPNIPPPNTWCLDTPHLRWDRESSFSSSLLWYFLTSICDWLIWSILHLEQGFKDKRLVSQSGPSSWLILC